MNQSNSVAEVKYPNNYPAFGAQNYNHSHGW
jgi:hypothetical protein